MKGELRSRLQSLLRKMHDTACEAGAPFLILPVGAAGLVMIAVLSTAVLAIWAVQAARNKLVLWV